jgi:peptidoglycan/xylan/chitin deacetylase (PgdA/CDA1 family)
VVKPPAAPGSQTRHPKYLQAAQTPVMPSISRRFPTVLPRLLAQAVPSVAGAACLSALLCASVRPAHAQLLSLPEAPSQLPWSVEEPDVLSTGVDEWRLDGVVRGVDRRTGAFSLETDVMVLRDSAASLGAQPTQRVLVDGRTRMWSNDGLLRPFAASALREGSSVIVIGMRQKSGNGLLLRARLIAFLDAIPPLPAPQRTSKARRTIAPKRTPQVARKLRSAGRRAATKRTAQVPAPAARTWWQNPKRAAQPAVARQPAPDRAALALPKRREVVTRPDPFVSAPSWTRQGVAIVRGPQRIDGPSEAPRTEPQLPSHMSQGVSAARTLPPRLTSVPSRRLDSQPQAREALLIAQPQTVVLAAGAPQTRETPLAPRESALAGASRRVPQPVQLSRPRPVAPPRISGTGASSAGASSRAAVGGQESNSGLASRRAALPSMRRREDEEARRPLFSARPFAAFPPSRSIVLSPRLTTGASGQARARSAARPKLRDAGAWRDLFQSDEARKRAAALRAFQDEILWPHFSGGPGSIVQPDLAQADLSQAESSPDVPQSGEKWVALTFDDGPHPNTHAVLDVLKRHNTPATFFVVGRNVREHPEILQRLAAEGHDIANHSFHHVQGVKLSAQQWRSEIEEANRAIAEVVGVAPRWFRAPGCRYSEEALEALSKAGMIRSDSTNNSGDWHQPSPQRIVEAVLARLGPMQVLLFHDPLPQTARALPLLLAELKKRGYKCVTLTALAQRAAQNPAFVPEAFPPGQGIVLPPAYIAAQRGAFATQASLPADAPALLRVRP